MVIFYLKVLLSIRNIYIYSINKYINDKIKIEQKLSTCNIISLKCQSHVNYSTSTISYVPIIYTRINIVLR